MSLKNETKINTNHIICTQSRTVWLFYYCYCNFSLTTKSNIDDINRSCSSDGSSSTDIDVTNRFKAIYNIAIQWILSLFESIFRWDQRLRPNGSTLVSAGVEFNQSPQLIIADIIGGSSLISRYFFVYFWISEKEWFSFIKT